MADIQRQTSSVQAPDGDAHHHHRTALEHLVFTVQYNLEHEKDWTSVTLHTHTYSGDDDGPSTAPASLGRRPLLYGLPPRRMYVHPDEQIEILKAEKDLPAGERIPQPPEVEWVLPIHLAEKWTVGGFAAVFDSIAAVPPGGGSIGAAAVEGDDDENMDVWKQWRSTRRGKRLILAIVQDDSTVSYYVMHDGIVKPRQN